MACCGGVKELVLTGRRGLETPGAPQAVAELEALGARVTVAAVDVADRGSACGGARGDSSATSAARGGARGRGARRRRARRSRRRSALRECCCRRWPARGICTSHGRRTSSTSSCCSRRWRPLGSAGQGNYAAANVFLDALASQRRAAGLAAQSLAWGRWSEGGMAASLDATQQARITRQGMLALTPAEGVALLGRRWRGPRRSWWRLNSTCGRWGGRPGTTVPPVWRALVQRQPRAGGRRTGAWAQRLATLPPERRDDEVRAMVRAELARVLSLGAGERLAADRPLSELGLDSLMAVELRNALGQRVGKTLPATLAFDYPTAGALSRWLPRREFVASAAASAGTACAGPPERGGRRRADRHRRDRLSLPGRGAAIRSRSGGFSTTASTRSPRCRDRGGTSTPGTMPDPDAPGKMIDALGRLSRRTSTGSTPASSASRRARR